MSGSEKAQKVEEGTVSASKPEVRNLESDENDNHFEGYNKCDGKPVHVNIDIEITHAGPALAFLLKKQWVRQWVETVLLMFAGQTEHFNHLTGWVVYHVIESET